MQLSYLFEAWPEYSQLGYRLGVCNSNTCSLAIYIEKTNCLPLVDYILLERSALYLYLCVFRSRNPWSIQLILLKLNTTTLQSLTKCHQVYV